MGLPCHTKSDTCESLLGFLQITAETDIMKLQFPGRLFILETTYLTKCIFITRLLSYLLKTTSNFNRIPQKWHPPPKAQWKRSARSSVIPPRLQAC